MAKPEPKLEAVKVQPFPERKDLAYQRGGKTRRLQVRIDELGNPNLEGISKEDKPLWQHVLKHPETQKIFGLAPEVGTEAAPPVPALSPATCGQFWDLFAVLEAVGFAWFYHCPRPLALEAFSLDEGDKAILVPPTQALAQKYGPEFLAKWGDEINLLMAFSLVNQGKYHAFRVRLAEEAKKAAKAVKPNGGLQAAVAAVASVNA
ncbi:MAG: hypothetical protein ABSA41_12600 [Terriglobia bacterium]|jgi:hypothetical protein